MSLNIELGRDANNGSHSTSSTELLKSPYQELNPSSYSGMREERDCVARMSKQQKPMGETHDILLDCKGGCVDFYSLKSSTLKKTL